MRLKGTNLNDIGITFMCPICHKIKFDCLDYSCSDCNNICDEPDICQCDDSSVLMHLYGELINVQSERDWLLEQLQRIKEEHDK